MLYSNGYPTATKSRRLYVFTESKIDYQRGSGKLSPALCKVSIDSGWSLLMDIQKDMHMAQHEVIQDIPTCRNSEYTMIGNAPQALCPNFSWALWIWHVQLEFQRMEINRCGCKSGAAPRPSNDQTMGKPLSYTFPIDTSCALYTSSAACVWRSWRSMKQHDLQRAFCAVLQQGFLA